MKILAVPSSAILPSMSHKRQLSKPSCLAPRSGRAHCWDKGSRPWRRAARISRVGRRKGDSVIAVPGRIGKRRVIDGEAPMGQFRIGPHAARRALLGPIHRPDIKRGVAIEALDALAHQRRPVHSPSPRGLRHMALANSLCAAMQIEVGRNAFEGARAVEDRGAEPGAMRARPHDRHIAVVPIVIEKRHTSSTRRWNGASHHPPVATVYVQNLTMHGLRHQNTVIRDSAAVERP